ncbi:hypothetical protein ACVIF9_008018 [Bradyrhizobium sp. USDA 4350]
MTLLDQMEAIMLLPYIYWRKLMQAHHEFYEDLIYV